MGEVYDKPRETLTAEQVDASLRYQIMDVVDEIRWIPDFGYERELDWLRNMHDWMISKKRYWGLALPIYDCAGVRHGRGHRRARRAAASARSRAGRRSRATPRIGRTSTRSRSPARAAASRSSGSRTSATRGSTPGSCPFSTLHYREDPDYWAQWFPADFITESFPGQFRNWFYSMLAMTHGAQADGAVQDDLRLRPRVRRGRPADAQELGQRDRVRRGGRADGRRRHALDVRQGPARGEHPVRLARGRRGAARAARPVERLRVLRHVRPAGRLDAAAGHRRGRRRRSGWPVLDRWILSRSGRAGGRGRGASWPTSTPWPPPARSARSSTTCRPGTCAARATGCAPAPTPADREAAFATLHAALVGLTRTMAPILPFLSETLYQNLVGSVVPALPDSVHLTAGRPARWRRTATSRSNGPMATVRGAVDLARTLRAQAGLRLRQPLRPMPGWPCPSAAGDVGDDLLAPVRRRDQRQAGRAASATSRTLVERRVKPLLPKIGKRLGSAIPAVMAAARAGEVEFQADGSVTLAGVDAGARRGRDPGHAAAGHGGRPPRWARRRPRHASSTPDAAGRGRRARARARDPGPAPRCRARARRPDRPVARRACPPAVAPHLADGRDRHAGRPRRWRRRAGRRHALDRRARRRPGGDRAPSRHGRRLGMAIDDVGDPPSGRDAGDGRRDPPRCALDRVLRPRRRWSLVLDQLTKAWLVANVVAGRGRPASSATASGSCSARTPGRCSGCSATTPRCSGWRRSRSSA